MVPAWLALAAAVPLAAAAPSCPRPAALAAALDPARASFADHRHRVALLGALRSCAGPEHAVLLGQAFVRSRHGALAEDPDLFEAALEGLRRLSPEAVEDAVDTGILPELTALTWADLHARWLAPALADDPARAASLAAARPADDPALAAATAAVGARLRAGLAADPGAFLRALSADGGSISQEAAADLRDALLAAVARSPDPTLAAVAARVGTASGHGGPRLARALAERAETAAPPLAATLKAAAAALPARPLRPVLGPPATPPGQLPGKDWVAPRQPDAAARSRPAAPARLPRGLAAVALGLGLGALAGALRRRPRGAALALGLALLAMADCLLAWAWPAAARLPELGLIPPPALRAQVADGGAQCWYGGPGTRIEGLPCRRDPAVPLVAVVGASSAHGSHHTADRAFAARLERRLADRGARVLNLGIGGASSATLAGWVGAGGPLSAEGGGPVDVLVVYYGHNEAAQLAAVQALAGLSLPVLRARLLARESGLYAALAALRPRTGRAALGDAPAPAVAPDPDALNLLAGLVAEHNLDLLLDAADAAGTRTVVVVPATNLRFAHVEAPPGDPLGAAAEAAAAAGDGDAAAALLQARIDAGASPRELVSPVRAALARVAGRHGATLIDAQQAFLARAPDGVTPSGLFWDDLHPSIDGHAVLAELIEPAVRSALDAPPPGAAP